MTLLYVVLAGALVCGVAGQLIAGEKVNNAFQIIIDRIRGARKGSTFIYGDNENSKVLLDNDRKAIHGIHGIHGFVSADNYILVDDEEKNLTFYNWRKTAHSMDPVQSEDRLLGTDPAETETGQSVLGRKIRDNWDSIDTFKRYAYLNLLNLSSIYEELRSDNDHFLIPATWYISSLEITVVTSR